ncbi:MAG: uroporphyrinogen decarboxylase family protein [Dehalobacterium sp.]
MSQMTSMERVMGVVKGEEVDKVPFILCSRHFGMRYSGQPLSVAYKSHEAYIASQMKLRKDFNLDAVWDIWCTPAVDDAAGAKMLIPEDDAPWIEDYCLASFDDMNKLKKVDPHKDGILPYMLEMVSKMKKTAGPDVPVITWVSPSFRSACRYRGQATIYMDMFESPKELKELIDFCQENTLAYVRALVEAGSDIIAISNPEVNAQCISKAHFAEWAHPYIAEMFAEAKKSGAKATLFHTCGNWDGRYDLIAQENADILHVDQVDVKKLKEEHGDKIVPMGNVKSVFTLLQKTPEDVAKETLECLKQGAPGGRYILSADCEVPRDTPVENVRAMAEVREKYGNYPLNF